MKISKSSKSNKSNKSRKSRQIVEKRMSIKAMERFARKIASNRLVIKNKTKITIRPCYIRSGDKNNFLASAHYIYINDFGNIIFNVIRINDFYFKDPYYNKQQIQATLLHEVGHLVNKHHETKYMNEFIAHRWAINKAKRMKLFKIVKILKDKMRSWLENTDGTEWGKKFSKHIKAAKYAKKVGLI